MALFGRSVLQKLVSEQRALQAALSGNLLQPAACWKSQLVAQQPFSSTSSLAEAAPRQRKPSIFAACVLERLPVVKSPPPEWEAEYKAWTQQRQMNEQLIKQYPVLDKKQKAREDADQGELKLVPAVTKADVSGTVSTMKRRLADKLVLLVKAHDPAAAAAAAAAAPKGSKVSSSSAAAAAAAAGQAVWTFPTTAHKAGESIREAAERALKEAIGPSQVYFIGNAPMAHLDINSSSRSSSSNSSSSNSSSAGNDGTSPTSSAAAATASSSSCSSRRPPARVFFHLAQVVNDPWDVSLQESSTAAEVAWVGKEELHQYLKDEALLALAHKML